ncbi:MAG: DEAD/DEAH box helicase [Gammaproteobacteria bacterium]|nr:DEAD/DEAH box helicase [Gammaproteobacteria bacterium]
MKKRPFWHQQEEFEAHWMDLVRAIHWEQGTGKTYLALWIAEELFKRGKIDALFVLAPNGLHTNWVLYEIPELVSIPHHAVAYHSKKAKTQRHQREMDYVTEYRDGLPILCMSYDAIKTATGKKVAKKFLTKRKCFYVADESNRIKTPSAKVTRTVVASGKLAKYKRTLCGTPITNTPFDIYTQFRFLDPDYWKKTEYGLAAYEDFKIFFGIWQKIKRGEGENQREFPLCVAFQNLDILSGLVADMSSRVLKEDVLKDLPPKLYTYKGFDMTPKQVKLYMDIETEFMTMLDGEMIFTPQVIVRLLRLQQILCGYLPTGEDNDCTPIDGKNPRLQLLGEITQDLPHKCIIWARFIEDINQICAMLGDKAVRWDGTVPMEEREENKRRFKTCPVEEVQFMVATPDSMGEGHTMNEAKTMIYYSNSYKLKERLQSEDRNHRAGQTDQVNIIDIVANNSMDLDIIASLRTKFDSASSVIDGKLRNWLMTYDDILDTPKAEPAINTEPRDEENAYDLYRGTKET